MRSVVWSRPAPRRSHWQRCWEAIIELVDGRLRLAAARADFLDSGVAAGVPDVVAASWRRSRSSGVQHDAYQVTYHDDIDTDSRLARCARPVLERLTNDMSDVPVSIALADDKARIIDRRDCSSAVGRVLDRVDFNPGFSFEETGCGTNGIGTVFEAGLAVSVVGSAHFNSSLTPFACTGAPVIDPITGRLEGVLDVSLLAESWSPLIHALVKTAAADIGRNLTLDRTRAQQALFEAYLRADTRTRHAVVAVGDTVILNQRAQHLLAPEDQLILQSHARFLITHPSRVDDVVPLPDGRLLHLRVVRVRAGADTSGVVLLISEVPHDRPVVSALLRPSRAAIPVPTSADGLPEHRVGRFEPAPSPISRTPAWNQAWRDVAEALDGGVAVLLVGEPGSGRVTIAAEVFDRIFDDGRHLVLDAKNLHTSEVSPLGRLGDVRVPTLLVLRDIDGLDAQTTQRALDCLEQCPAPVRLAATVRAALPSDHPATALLPRFGTSAFVPALRHRAEDLPQIIEAMVNELAPGRRVRLSPEATRVLGAHPWPGNLPQLRESLAAALTRRPVGEIQVDDLPGGCRASSAHTLSRLESAERDAIVVALRTHAGNRVHAAASVGMSRSSLYRKMKHYGLTDLN